MSRQRVVFSLGLFLHSIALRPACASSGLSLGLALGPACPPALLAGTIDAPRSCFSGPVRWNPYIGQRPGWAVATGRTPIVWGALRRWIARKRAAQPCPT